MTTATKNTLDTSRMYETENDISEQRRSELNALMNQRLMAGVGNVFKSEILFIRRVSPFARVDELSEETLRGLIEESHKLLRLNRASIHSRLSSRCSCGKHTPSSSAEIRPRTVCT